MAENKKKKYKKRPQTRNKTEKRQAKQASVKGSLITAAAFLIVVFGFGAAGVLSPDRSFSDMENRTLAQKPEFSFERLKNGEFTADIEKYMSDQIFLKDQLVGVRTAADRMLMKSYLNGVYFGSDGYYLQDFQPNAELVRNNIAKLGEFAQKLGDQVEMDLLLAPNAVCVLEDKLPLFSKSQPQEDIISLVERELDKKITFISPVDKMKVDQHKDSFYYRTDHHWTATGAEFAYIQLMQGIGESVPKAEYQSDKLEDFYGTLYSKAPASDAQADTLELPVQRDNKITVKYTIPKGDHDVPKECKEVDGIMTKKGLMAAEPQSTKDKYASLMGGNFALCEIETQGELDQRVLIIKDSYANAMLPYLCSKYQHISVIDLRYYHMEEQTVSEYVKDKGIERVIGIYNVDFLNSDNNFAWLD